MEPGPKKPYDPKRSPDFANVSYGPYERNVLDIYQAKSSTPAPLILYIHGGGFVGGSKEKLSADLLELANRSGITIAAMNYRYATQAPYPAQFEDAVRALQFLRLHASDYNLNPRAATATGDSSGAVLSLWLGFHPDMADPASADPLKRQSTRLSVVGVTDAQTTADLREMAKLVGNWVWTKQGFATEFGLKLNEMQTERAYRIYEQASPMTYLGKDSPPVFLYFHGANVPITDQMPQAQRGHHPIYGFYLKKHMDALGLECVVRLRADYAGDMEATELAMNEEMVQFFLRYFAQ